MSVWVIVTYEPYIHYISLTMLACVMLVTGTTALHGMHMLTALKHCSRMSAHISAG